MKIIFTFLVLVFSLSATPVLADGCELSIQGTDQMTYSVTELTASASCKTVKVTLKHAGTQPKAAMGHNWVLTAAKDKDTVLTAAFGAGPEKDYLPKGHKAVVAHTKLVGGGESDTVSFALSKLKKGTDYVFFCTFPGHASMMTGKFLVK